MKSEKQMSNSNQIRALFEAAGKLLAVRYSVYNSGLNRKDWIDAVELQFEGVVVTIYAETDFDTIQIELSELRVREDCYVKEATSLNPWDKVTGKLLEWIWLLINQQGYEDGYRFEFSSKGVKEVITFVVIASRIQIYHSEEIKLSEMINETP
ncbi:MAG: hypothetical protein JNM09_08960 [Blastocatellia bacterium]|nr:hypothetical protein [Blastocatellia bacterium]